MLKTTKKIIVITTVLLIAGCSGVNYAYEHYGNIVPKKHYYNNKLFYVFDRHEKSRLMITPSAGASFLQGFTFGAASTAEQTFQAAAQAYLDSTGRKCKAGDMKLVIDPQWETFYKCN